MFEMFKRENQNKAIRQLVMTDLKILPRNKVSQFVTTDNSYFKIMPGRKISAFCQAPKNLQFSYKVSTFN